MLDPADLDAIGKVFRYYEVKDTGNADILLGDLRVDADVLYGSLYPYFSRRHKAVALERHLGETALVIKGAKADNVWINVALALATFVTTTIAGALMYNADIFNDPLRVYEGLPFALAIMAVLGAHELGHYIVSKKHGIDATLPYFIPFPPFFTLPIGTMGALIRQKGPVPNRKALFDVGISGPLAGLAVAIVITAIGLMLPAPAVNTDTGASYYQLGTPILFDLLAGLIHPGLRSINPIAFAGWVGMLVTVLNMIPIGQLDGGHVARAVLGRHADRLSRALPVLIFAFGAYTSIVLGMQGGQIWLFWGLLTTFMGSGGHPKPLDDTGTIGLPRIALCAVGFGLTLLCFTPFPVSA